MNNQGFRVEDKVYDIILGEVGIVKEVNINDISAFQIEVVFENHGTLLYPHEDKYISRRLLHYREDYNYDVIDFKNLPKRQEPKRWRAKKDGLYYFINFITKDWFFSDETKDDYDPIDNDNYNSGNYFRTEVEAEIIAQKLNSYFKQLIKEEHEHERI